MAETNTGGSIARLQGFDGTNPQYLRTNDNQNTTANRLAVAVGSGVMTTLSAATSNSNGTAFALGSAHTRLAFQVTVTGGPAAYTVTAQVSIDGTTWTAVAPTITQADANGIIKYVTDSGLCFTRCRAVLSALSGGTVPTVTCVMAAS